MVSARWLIITAFLIYLLPSAPGCYWTEPAQAGHDCQKPLQSHDRKTFQGKGTKSKAWRQAQAPACHDQPSGACSGLSRPCPDFCTKKCCAHDQPGRDRDRGALAGLLPLPVPEGKTPFLKRVLTGLFFRSIEVADLDPVIHSPPVFLLTVTFLI